MGRDCDNEESHLGAGRGYWIMESSGLSDSRFRVVIKDCLNVAGLWKLRCISGWERVGGVCFFGGGIHM